MYLCMCSMLNGTRKILSKKELFRVKHFIIH